MISPLPQKALFNETSDLLQKSLNYHKSTYEVYQEYKGKFRLHLNVTCSDNMGLEDETTNTRDLWDATKISSPASFGLVNYAMGILVFLKVVTLGLFGYDKS